MKLADCIPGHKADLLAVAHAERRGFPVLADVLPKLLPWIKDPTWPVAEPLVQLLATAGREIAPHLMVILVSDDQDLKLAVLVTLGPKLTPPVRELLRPEVTRLATSPAPAERQATIDEAAQLLLTAWDSSPAPRV